MIGNIPLQQIHKTTKRAVRTLRDKLSITAGKNTHNKHLLEKGAALGALGIVHTQVKDDDEIDYSTNYDLKWAEKDPTGQEWNRTEKDLAEREAFDAECAKYQKVYDDCIEGFRSDWHVRTEFPEMDNNYTEMVKDYCRAAHLESHWRDKAEQKQQLKDYYKDITDYQKFKQLEVYGEKRLAKVLKAEYEDMVNELKEVRLNKGALNEGQKEWFKDEADLEWWKKIRSNTDACVKGGTSFTVSISPCT